MTNKQNLALHRLQRKVCNTAKLTLMLLPDTEVVHIIALWNYLRRANNKAESQTEIEKAIYDAYMSRLEDSDD